MEFAAPNHAYVWTMAGRCARCQRTLGEHLMFLANPENCNVDHASVTTSHTGTRWTLCPMCGQQVEPKMATGELPGPLWGKGRGGLSKRDIARLEFIIYRRIDA